MPKVASKINIVDFNAEVLEAVEEVVEDSPEVETPPEAVVDPEAVVEPVLPKAKVKAKAKAKPVEEVPVPVEPVEVLVPCPKCGKKMKPKTLQYSHKCPMDKAVEVVPVAPVVDAVVPVRAVSKEIVRVPPKPIKVEKEQAVDYSSIPEEVLDAEINKRASASRQTKVLKKQESIKKLSKNIA
jgi:hypothetical protein